ncbi:uncharacterized protein LOC141596372 [Silene latifolia]|uniref:uncharacterized protein LOC141596372 n=1 Tax=Silene latifolia TaxID=37657 RepID=UPI003D7815AA
MPLFFTAIVPFDQCRLMIHHLLQQKAPQVSVDIKDNIATLRAGNDNNSWTANYPMLKAYGSRAMEAGENYSTSFQWTNASVAALLQKASEMDDGFVLLFHAERPKSIILRFYLGEVGYLEFMRECSTTFSWTRS